MNSKTYWLGIKRRAILRAWASAGYDLSARWRFARIPRTISENWMVPK